MVISHSSELKGQFALVVKDEVGGFICGLISISHLHTEEPEDKKKSKKRSMKVTE